jgi:hypothetical protein
MVQGAEMPTRRKSFGNWVVLPVLILLFAALYLALFSSVISWALGGGTQGTFTAQALDCHHGCSWFGEFTSTDHKMPVLNVVFVNVNRRPNIKAGTVIPVVDITSALTHGSAYPRHPTLSDIISSPLLVVVLLGFLPIILSMLWIWTVPIRYWRRKAA